MTDTLPITQRTMVMVDALLDTRMGILLQSHPEIATDLFNNIRYYTRANDELSQLDDRLAVGEFEKLYRERNGETLMQSVITPMIYMVSELSFQFDDQRIHTPYTEDTVIELNVWPYAVNDDVAETLAAALYNYVPYDTKIEIVEKPVSELTPALLKADYSCLILYDLAEWFQIHCASLETCIIPTVTVMAPKLHVNGQQAFGRDLFGEGLEHIEPYDAIQRFISPLIGLEFLDMRLCCILRPEEAQYRHDQLKKRLEQMKKEQR